jgi:glycosyltransferase involved in cell wall biosynthesis
MSEDPRPRVSVIIPCYAQAHFLHEAIESVLAQNYPEIEVIVVDDGSPDDAAEVAGRYRGVRVVRQENRGLAGARNAGLGASTGEYVLFLDADDRLTPSAVEAHLSCFGEHADAGFVVGDIDQIDNKGAYVYSPRWPMLQADFYEELLRVNHVANTIAVMFRRSVFRQIGDFDASCTPAEDYEMLLRAARTFPSAHHRTVVAQYRRHSATLSRQGIKMLAAMRSVVGRQWEFVQGDARLRKAWKEGDRYWKEHFGVAAVRETLAYIRRGQLWRALSAVVQLIRYMGARVFLLPLAIAQRVFHRFRRSRAASSARQAAVAVW